MAVLPGNVVAARDEAGRLAEQAGGLQSQLPTIGDELRKRVNTLFGENQDVLGGFNTAVSNLVSAPGRSYETTQDVRDPFARERLAAIDLSTALQPTLAYGGLLGQRMGSIGDIVESGTNAFKAKVQAAATAAELARQKYQDLFQEFTTLEQMRQRKLLAKEKRVFRVVMWKLGHRLLGMVRSQWRTYRLISERKFCPDSTSLLLVVAELKLLKQAVKKVAVSFKSLSEEHKVRVPQVCFTALLFLHNLVLLVVWLFRVMVDSSRTQRVQFQTY